MNKIAFCFLFLMSSYAQSQVGGKYIFDFLNSPTGSRITALGGSLISVVDDDITLAFQNPAVGNQSMDDKLSFNHIFHFSGISEGHIGYGYNLDSLGIHLHGGFQYVSYGNFLETNEIGIVNGEFKANEVALIFGGSKKMNDRISVGVSTKFIFAGYAGYNGWGMAVDGGVIYQVPDKNWTLGLVLQNVGFSNSQFDSENLNLPFDVKLGYSNKLKYLPFRYTITAQQFHRWNLDPDDPNAPLILNFLGEVVEENQFSEQIDNFFRHFIFSGEFLLGKKELLRLRFAYNHLRKQQLKLETFRSLGGFSFGFGIKIKRFRLDYGLGYYHIAGATNHVGINFLINRK